MAGGTLNIDTSTALPGLTLVSDINTALAALAVDLQSATAPTAASLGIASLAGIKWHDTGNNIVFIRDLADTVWIPIFSIDETGKKISPPANTVPNSSLGEMPAETLKGNNAGSLADPADLTVTQVRAMLVAPYFQARMSGTQSITTGAVTKVQFDTEDYDNNNNYDPANYRFTPTVAGVYRIRVAILGVAASFSTGAGVVAYLKKNGTTYVAISESGALSSTTSNTVEVEAMITFDGTTDYVEAWALSSGTTPSIVGSNNQGLGEVDSYFQGTFIGP